MKKINILFLAIALIIFTIIIVFINGKTYTVKIENVKSISNADELDIIINDENVKCTDIGIEDDFIYLKFDSISQGKSEIDVFDKDGNGLFFFTLYVHKYGIITYSTFFGDATGSIAIPMSIAIWLVYVIIFSVKKYKAEMNNNIYQYKNIAYLGLIIFLVFSLIYQLITLIGYQGLSDTIKKIIGLCSIFSMGLLPITFITSILVVISNSILLKKEGININNILGILLGATLCFLTLFPGILNEILQNATWVDVHNEQGAGPYIQDFIEVAIYITVSYLECILIGTIVLGIKSAKHIPEFNKDYIIILGCQIKKDGTLTNLLKNRVDRAIEFRNMQKEQTRKDIIFVPSGGQGIDEIIPESHAMKNYLLQMGIGEENILVEDKSTNTYENIKFSYDLIQNKNQNAKIAFSTTNYHVYRAGAIADSLGLKFEGIGAKTKSYFWVNAFIREYIATLFSEKKKHIVIIIELLLFAIVMIEMLYLSNVI